MSSSLPSPGQGGVKSVEVGGARSAFPGQAETPAAPPAETPAAPPASSAWSCWFRPCSLTQASLAGW